jgi:hypothetical protein
MVAHGIAARVFTDAGVCGSAINLSVVATATGELGSTKCYLRSRNRPDRLCCPALIDDPETLIRRLKPFMLYIPTWRVKDDFNFPCFSGLYPGKIGPRGDKHRGPCR